MSVIFKSEKEYSEILGALRSRASYNGDFRSILRNLFHNEIETLKEYHNGLNEEELIETVLYWFVADLYRANDISYTARYNEPTKLLPLQVVKVTPIYNQFEIIKALQSVRYQIEVPHKYSNQLDKIICHLALSVVQDNPLYEKAKTW